MSSRALQIGRAVAVASLAMVALGCASEDKVVRVIDGRPVAGEFVPAEAYASYLRGSIADSAGDLAGAIEAYSIATTLGPRDPEPLARLGDARCRKDLRDRGADDAIGRALAIDATYAPALEAMARCAELRGDAPVAREYARRAMKEDPASGEPLATLARLEASGRGPASEELRARLVALTLAEGASSVAWDALATWARAHGDGLLEARALSHVLASTAARRAEVDAAIARLDGAGEIVAARSLARARVDAGDGGAIDPRTARLAVDDALLAGDSSAARRLAVQAHLPGVVVAARALLHGDAALARVIASTLVAADPSAVAPRLVLAIAGPGVAAASATLLAGSPDDGPVPPEVWLAYVSAVAREGSVEGARAVLQGLSRAPLVAGDRLSTPVAVALAASGALEAGELDAGARIQLAGGTPARKVASVSGRSVK